MNTNEQIKHNIIEALTYANTIDRVQYNILGVVLPVINAWTKTINIRFTNALQSELTRAYGQKTNHEGTVTKHPNLYATVRHPEYSPETWELHINGGHNSVYPYNAVLNSRIGFDTAISYLRFNTTGELSQRINDRRNNLITAITQRNEQIGNIDEIIEAMEAVQAAHTEYDRLTKPYGYIINYFTGIK